MTDGALKEYAADHLDYEIWMAFSSAKQALHPQYKEEPIIKNALLESCLLHVRNLKEFLYDQRQYPDDIIADDYVADAEAWRQARGPLPDTLSKATRRIDKGMAHLTTGRNVASPVEKLWAPYRLLAALVGPLNQFTAMVPEERLGPELRQLISSLRASSVPE